MDRPYAARARRGSLKSAAFADSSTGRRLKIEPSPTSLQSIIRGMRVHGDVARHQVDLREEGTTVGLRELEALQPREDVLVGHGGVAEARAAVSDVAPVVDLVVVVEGRPRRPCAVVRRHVIDGSPPGPSERLAEREAVGLDELVVAPLAVDPDARLHGGVRQPADAAERRRGEEAAPRREAGGLQPPGSAGENGIDLGRERGALDRDLAVALDEREDDVLAAQAGQQLVAGSVAEAVVADLLGEDRRGRGCRPAPRAPCRRPGRRRSWRRSGVCETSWAPNAQHSTQTTPSAATAWSDHRRWPAATRVSRSTASVVRTSRATASTTAPTTTRFASVRPIEARSVSMPIPA